MHSEIVLKINTVIDYIENHLSEKLPLEKLSEIGNLSKFHFHRSFKMITQETPNEYIIRKRIEKIASLLTVGTQESISDLSAEFGFENLSSFSRSFKKHYGYSASEFKRRLKSQPQIKRAENSKIGKTSILSKAYIYESEKLKSWMTIKATINVQFCPEISLAYVRHWGSPYTINEAFDKLQAWTRSYDKDQIGENYYTLFHDNPSLTDDYKIQQSACVEVKNPEALKGEISLLNLPSQKYLMGQFELTETEFGMAWDSMIIWINENDLKPKEGPRFEKFLDRCLFDDSQTFKVALGIPLK